MFLKGGLMKLTDKVIFITKGGSGLGLDLLKVLLLN
jgi:short-subunit dehydrogenase involved in D-alanine esterification of teichoic acids